MAEKFDVVVICALSKFGKARASLDPHGSAEQSITSGIYRLQGILFTWAFCSWSLGCRCTEVCIGGLILVPIFMYFMNQLVIEREEAYLEKKFGDVYTSYKSRLRRWL